MFLIKAARTATQHLTCHMPHSTFNIPHPTPNIAHPTFHIQHSTFSTSLPQIYTVFPVEHRLAFKYAILAHLCNHLTFNHLPHKEPIRYPTRPIPLHEKPCFDPPSLPFRGSISYLSRLHPSPIAHRNMPNAPFRPSRRPFKTPKKALPPLYFARKPNTRFTPKFLTAER